MKTIVIAMLSAGALAAVVLSGCDEKAPDAKPAAAPTAPAGSGSAAAAPAPPAKHGGW